MSPWGNFCLKLGVINHDYDAELPQSVYGSCKHSYCIPECFSSLDWVWCFFLGGEGGGGLGRACLVYVRKLLFFSAAGLPQWALKLQIYKCSTLTGKKHTKLGTKSNTCCTGGFSEMSYEWSAFLWQEVTTMKEMRGEDSVEAETGMANNHFLVAWHSAQRQRTRDGKNRGH